MSGTVPTSVIVAEYRANLADNYTTCLTTTLACYEYFFLLEHEILLLRRKWTGVTWLFLANRYFMVASVITLITPYTPKTCFNAALQDFLTVITLMPGVVAAAFSALRAFALLHRNYYVAALVFLLGMVPLGTSAYIIKNTSYYYVNDPVLGASCYGTFTVSPSAAFYSNGVAARLAVILADLIAVVATWSQTFHHVRHATALGVQGVSSVILRDGSIYFIAILILNVARLLVDSIPSWQSGNPVSNVSDVLQPILISRFIVNLRQANDSNINDTSTQIETVAPFSTFRFRISAGTIDTVVGPMGQPLEYEPPLRD